VEFARQLKLRILKKYLVFENWDNESIFEPLKQFILAEQKDSLPDPAPSSTINFDNAPKGTKPKPKLCLLAPKDELYKVNNSNTNAQLLPFSDIRHNLASSRGRGNRLMKEQQKTTPVLGFVDQVTAYSPQSAASQDSGCPNDFVSCISSTPAERKYGRGKPFNDSIVEEGSIVSSTDDKLQENHQHSASNDNSREDTTKTHTSILELKPETAYIGFSNRNISLPAGPSDSQLEDIRKSFPISRGRGRPLLRQYKTHKN